MEKDNIQNPLVHIPGLAINANTIAASVDWERIDHHNHRPDTNIIEKSQVVSKEIFAQVVQINLFLVKEAFERRKNCASLYLQLLYCCISKRLLTNVLWNLRIFFAKAIHSFCYLLKPILGRLLIRMYLTNRKNYRIFLGFTEHYLNKGGISCKHQSI